MPGSVLRLAGLFPRTLRDTPSHAELASHILLVRAGYIRRTAPGIYVWLPLGLMVLRNVERIVREEMQAIGAQEVLLPALLPSEAFEVTGRWDEYGDLLFRLRDRRGTQFLLGPTHEEIFTQLVEGSSASHKDFPLTLFQIQTKYRDEARPRGGLLRGREFTMKDSYSFDLDDDGLRVSYNAHREAYTKIFDRIGLKYQIVSAVSGAMGGSTSEEFLAPAGAGEDTFVSCPDCGYAANSEAFTFSPVERRPAAAHPPTERVATPNVSTIGAVSTTLRVDPAQILKSLIIQVDGRPALLILPGDREADLKRLAAALAPSSVELLAAVDLAEGSGLSLGFVGPQGAQDRGLTVYADPRVAPGSAWVTGANEPGIHCRNVVNGRDFTVDRYLDSAEVRPGDPCPVCGNAVGLERAIEIGHIFQLGEKYSRVFGLDAPLPDGTHIPIKMGSYGIGVSRAVAALAEQTLDTAGLSWPWEVAPAHVHVIPVGKEDQLAVSERLASDLSAAGLTVIIDDRALAPGVAFADADLLGIPLQVIVGRALSDGEVEFKRRDSGERRRVAIDDAVRSVRSELAASSKGLRAGDESQAER